MCLEVFFARNDRSIIKSIAAADYPERVSQQSPGSRSAPWVGEPSTSHTPTGNAVKHFAFSFQRPIGSAAESLGDFRYQMTVFRRGSLNCDEPKLLGGLFDFQWLEELGLSDADAIHPVRGEHSQGTQTVL